MEEYYIITAIDEFYEVDKFIAKNKSEINEQFIRVGSNLLAGIFTREELLAVIDVLEEGECEAIAFTCPEKANNYNYFNIIKDDIENSRLIKIFNEEESGLCVVLEPKEAKILIQDIVEKIGE